MRKLLLLGTLFLNGCLYSFEDECIKPIIQVVSSGCEKNKGEEFPVIAHYQKKSNIGSTNSEQRWRDAVSCGAKYGDNTLRSAMTKGEKEPIDDILADKFDNCMSVRGYIWIQDCGYQNPKWDKGVCNL
ncbi:hypothetical protein [Actinobacillus porcinus]|uniref:hypothetical protein n=1 Tax=Actinobacillus porcinus TaxID=51048 RepID=UPI0023546590|nr:hypothetical protein [Actinobacillus porcinus]